MTQTKRFFYISLVIITAGLSLTSCNSKSNKSTSSGEEVISKNFSSDGKVVAYYFHATRRCATCEAVEKVSKATLQEYYGSDVSFVSINREKDENADLVNYYKVNGQTLLIVKDDKIFNLTNNAFLNARTNPDKLKSKLKETIDPLL